MTNLCVGIKKTMKRKMNDRKEAANPTDQVQTLYLADLFSSLAPSQANLAKSIILLAAAWTLGP